MQNESQQNETDRNNQNQEEQQEDITIKIPSTQKENEVSKVNKEDSQILDQTVEKNSSKTENPKKLERKNTKRSLTKKKTSKVEIQEPEEAKTNSEQQPQKKSEIFEITQTNQEGNNQAQKELEQKELEQKELEQKEREEEQKLIQEQQEQLQKSKLKEQFLKSLVYPSKKSNTKKTDKLYQTIIVQFELEECVQRKCKSVIKPKREKPRSKSVINKELIDFYNKLNPQKPKVEELDEEKRYTPRTYQKLLQDRQIDGLKRDLENLENSEEQQQSHSQPQKPQNKKKNKNRSSTQPKKKVELIIVHKQVKKVKIRNGLRERMAIDKDRDKQLAALDFIKKMQQTRIDAEKKRQEQVQNIGARVTEELEILRQGNRVYREEMQQRKRKVALEQITKHEQKRYEQMMKQQQTEKFIRELREKAAALGHYSAKKLGSPQSLVTELENGGIAIEQYIDSNRKMNENQFILLEEQKILRKVNKKKQIDYSKQVSLFHLPKVGVQKKSPKDYVYQSVEPLPEIKPKHKKAWQIEQELTQKRGQHHIELEE